MKKTCLLSGNFALDTIVTREYPNGFVIRKANKFIETVATECVGNTCGNVATILPYLGVYRHTQSDTLIYLSRACR